jgi:hypothetical protein
MPPSRVRDILGQALRPDDQVVYLIRGVQGLVIGRVTLMHMHSVIVERLHPKSDAVPVHDELMNGHQVVRVHRTT